MTSHPRPILKRESPPPPLPTDLPFATCDHISSPHVHFPPTPCMSSLRFTHSPNTYDRAPIIVSPNEFLLPKRGRRMQSPPVSPPMSPPERGRSRSRSRDSSDMEEDVKGSYFHPRAYEACTLEPPRVPTATFDMPSPPSLIPDLSPSDESDDLAQTPPDPQMSALIAVPIPGHLAYPLEPCAPASPVCEAHKDGVSGVRVSSPNLRPAKGSSEGRKGPRPRLRKNSAVKSAVSFDTNLDEGCLGGF